ncbi:MAG: GHMP kinase [Hyphomicrobiales bacterium]|nr:GHMP kinase [Hyphomicrobiales bacterium]MBV9431912.1 GHMP kinase [Hyphomicrobiales bacterium]
MIEGRKVVVSAAARLHLGFLDLNGGLGRRFGSIGIAIDGPVTRLSLARAARGKARGPDSERAATHLAALARRFKGEHDYELTIEEAIPAHAGLGSGTTLALAVAAAFRRLEGMRENRREDIRTLSRGERSGIGIAVFRNGGFVVDGGRGPDTTEPPIVTRLPFPANWRILLLQDASVRGIHGDRERAAFSALALFDEVEADRICRMVLMQLLPGLVEKRIVPFGEAVRSIQERLGDYFAPMQGGRRFASSTVEAALEALGREGAHGIGQSSWGPTGFAFAESLEEAQRLKGSLRRNGLARDLDISIRRGLNRGARIEYREAGTSAAREGELSSTA